jgi:medium-chain acyl-[acyl-carrier-protein] hydrolase
MTNTPISDPWIQYWQRKSGARIRLFCFPYAGGGVSLFRTWPQSSPPEVEVCPVQLPGRENRLTEVAFSHIHPLIDTLAMALRPYLDMPYAFFGHSMGALISFELARRLRQTEPGLEPVHLFVSGRRAPQLPDPDPPTHDLPEAEFIEELRRLKGTPEDVLQNEELLHLLLPLLRADFALCETYTYDQDKPLGCAISAFSGLQDAEVPRDVIAAWKKQTYSSFRLRLFVGGHFFVDQQQASLLRAISQDLFNSLR